MFACCELWVHEAFIIHKITTITSGMLMIARLFLFLIMVIVIVLEEKSKFLCTKLKYLDALLWLPIWAGLIYLFPKFDYDRQYYATAGTGLIILGALILYIPMLIGIRLTSNMIMVED